LDKANRIIEIKTPLSKERARSLKAGDLVSITGIIYSARDAAHKKITELLSEGKELPFDLKDQIIFYAGPCPARPGAVIGPVGPTTSGRMDAYASALIELGLTGMIGKGLRSKNVVDAMVKHQAVYFAATGGTAAVIAKSIKEQEVIAFPELGTEAVRKLTVKDFKVVVAIDSFGNSLYVTGKEKYRV
jgi:fumarate hydratase subunit beta